MVISDEDATNGSSGGSGTILPTTKQTRFGVVQPNTQVGVFNQNATIRCCGPITGFICREIQGNVCPIRTTECDVSGESCRTTSPNTTQGSPAPPIETSTLIQFTPTITTTTNVATTTTTITPTPTPTTTTFTIPVGACKSDLQCGTNRKCDFSEPLYVNNNLNDPYGKCVDIPPVFCTYEDVATACFNLPGFGEYFGVAFSKVINTNSTPGCIQDPRIVTEWDVSQCFIPEQIQQTTEECSYVEQTRACSSVKGGSEWTGVATRLTLSPDNKLNCIKTFGDSTEWDTSNCSRIQPSECRVTVQQQSCQELLGDEYFSTQVLTRRVLVRNQAGQPLPLGCDANNTSTDEYDLNLCVKQPEPLEEECGCYSYTALETSNNFGVTNSITYTPCGESQPITKQINRNQPFGTICASNSSNVSGILVEIIQTGNDCKNNPNVCRPLNQLRCIPPQGPTTEIQEIPCEQVSTIFNKGNARRIRTRTFNRNAAGPDECPWSEWINQSLDDSLCSYEEPPQPCIAPLGGFTEAISVPCSEIDPRFNKGVAVKNRIRSYNRNANGPGLCPYTEWENGPVNTTQCTFEPALCVPPTGDFREVVEVLCSEIDPRLYNSGTALKTRSRSYNQNVNGPGECPYTQWQDTGLDTSACQRIPVFCTPPSGPFTQTIDVTCTSISPRFTGGLARQTQTRTFNSQSPGPGECQFNDWKNSGAPDTSLCQVVNDPKACVVPRGPFTRQISVPCSQVDIKYSRGNATQTQTRRYDPDAPGPNQCPYTEWEDEGIPNTISCVEAVFWRNCVNGQLIEGSPPVDYTESTFQGAGGGTCYEPASELGFSPNLGEALRYTYQKGSSKLPESKNITVTNPSFSISYRVTLITNQDVKFSKGRQHGDGTLSFIIGPRSNETFTINVTPELLEQLRIGLSTISMTIEYERVL